MTRNRASSVCVPTPASATPSIARVVDVEPMVVQSLYGPSAGSEARKHNVSPTAVKAVGSEEEGPVAMSFSRIVPAVVPSDVHSSSPWVPSFAEKYKASLMAVR